MKKTILALIAALFVVVGCQENNSILEPENEQFEASTLNKGRIIINRDLDDDDDIFDRLDFSYDDDTKTLSVKSKTFTVDGKTGDEIFVSETFLKDGKLVSMSAKLTIPQRAFKGTITFDMIFDFDNYTLELYPSPFTFDKPVLLDLTFWGVNFDELEFDITDFSYLDGLNEKINVASETINKDWGLLKVEGAELNHFSRYGWVRIK